MNENPFQKAEARTKRLKLFLWGQEGSGKTILSLQFPKPVMIDMERGSDLYGNDYDFNVINTTDVDEVMESVDWLLTNKHEYRTLIIDPITIYWSALQDKYSKIFLQREKKSPGYKFEYYKIQPSDWGIIKSELKQLIRKLTLLDMNVIVTAHQKKEYAEGEFMKVVGDTFDGEKSLPYMFDTIIRMQRKGGKFIGTMIKDRTNKLPDKDFEISYSLFESLFTKEALTKKATPVKFATPDQVNEIDNYRVMLLITEDKFKKSLTKYDAETIEELTEDNANIIIGKLEETYNKTKEKEKSNVN